MPRKRQSTPKDKPAGKSKANLGQTEAELEKIGKEPMSHMGDGKASKTAQRQPTTVHKIGTTLGLQLLVKEISTPY